MYIPHNHTHIHRRHRPLPTKQSVRTLAKLKDLVKGAVEWLGGYTEHWSDHPDTAKHRYSPADRAVVGASALVGLVAVLLALVQLVGSDGGRGVCVWCVCLGLTHLMCVSLWLVVDVCGWLMGRGRRTVRRRCTRW
jgi:hypothetical protein